MHIHVTSIYVYVSTSIHLTTHKRPRERRMRVSACECDSIRSAFDSAAVGRTAKTDSRPDSRADRPRRYRLVCSAQRHACAVCSAMFII